MTDSKPAPGWAMYLRVSNEDKQTPERSFAFQRQRIQEYLLADSDVPFQREYCDVLTGTTPKRLDYQQMLADAEALKFSHLGLYRADRFGRNALEGLQAASRLMSYGVKIRVAHMPSLAPETPDGFFMFMLQMGLAQREVEVMRQRINDGMDAKYRAGGWAGKAPEGYLNKEEQVKSGKYYRWVEQDPELAKVLREAWDLLLTGRYTLVQICEELTARGYTRIETRPWTWTDPKTRNRRHAFQQLFKIFHNPFYAGWVVAPKYGIAMGEVRGNWEPIISTVEYEQGLEILRKNDSQKSRMKRHHYLLRHLLWVEADGKLYKTFGTTPSGKRRPYSYYATLNRPSTNGKQIYVLCELVDNQVSDLLGSICIAPDKLLSVREVYSSQIQISQRNDDNKRLTELQKQLTQIREEELRFARLLVTGKITDEAYDRLRAEWQDKVRILEGTIATIERDTGKYVDDLDAALLLLSQAADLFARLEERQRSTLLQIIFSRIIVSPNGEIINYELNSPFSYIYKIAVPPTKRRRSRIKCSEQIYSGPPEETHSKLPVMSQASAEVEQFLAVLRFEHRSRLAELEIDLV